MPRAARAPSFTFYYNDYLGDAALGAMTFDQQGRYWRAVCMSWNTPTPGVALEEMWRLWMKYTPAQWEKVRATVGMAFRVDADTGVWTQKRARETREDQAARYEQAVSGARASNAKQGRGPSGTGGGR